jgi:alkylation response protein AidB-like acyl-CoA dehydrogenase
MIGHSNRLTDLVFICNTFTSKIMSKYINLDLLRFLLNEVHPLRELFAYPRFQHLDEPTAELMLAASKAYSDQYMFPLFREMDETPAQWKAGRVETHPYVGEFLRASGENGWIGGRDDFDYGGMQMPETLYAFIHIILEAANNAAQGYVGLTGGAAHLITAFGSKELIDTYVPNMYSGHWQGTMALTEPQAGSSLSDITTSAKPVSEGYFLVKGHKIFISGGDHSGADNFVHLTLARIEGAPAGVKGISLFVIPRLRPDGAGGWTYNDVETVSDFQKLGQRGYSTTHLAFGEKDDCHAWLVGEPHKGLAYMFQMMNEARIGVGHTAAAVAMAAYLHALQYANERPQGRLPGNRDPLAPPVMISRHADVQRMLLTQQCIVEGALSLTAECTMLADRARQESETTKQQQYHLLLEILTPILKTYATEHGIRAVNLGVQVLGGYGYTMDFSLQQYLRDIRIMAIYEGTTGIQSLDLLGRKVTMNDGLAFKLLIDTIQNSIVLAKEDVKLADIAEQLQQAVDRVGEVTETLMTVYRSGDAEAFTADATVYMEMTSLLVIGWQWLKMAQSARRGGAFDDEFYAETIKCLHFFYRYEMSHLYAYANTVVQGAKVLA